MLVKSKIKKTVPELLHAQGADFVTVVLVKNDLFAVEVAVCVPAHVVVCLHREKKTSKVSAVVHLLVQVTIYRELLGTCMPHTA
jgi:hypothetical protein